MSHYIDRAVGQAPARGPRYEEPSDGDQDLLLDEATKNSRRREVCVVLCRHLTAQQTTLQTAETWFLECSLEYDTISLIIALESRDQHRNHIKLGYSFIKSLGDHALRASESSKVLFLTPAELEHCSSFQSMLRTVLQKLR